LPASASLLRRLTAVLAETSEAWEAGRIFLNRDCLGQPSVGRPTILQKKICVAVPPKDGGAVVASRSGFVLSRGDNIGHMRGSVPSGSLAQEHANQTRKL
jgi:hypothetical protein